MPVKPFLLGVLPSPAFVSLALHNGFVNPRLRLFRARIGRFGSLFGFVHGLTLEYAQEKRPRQWVVDPIVLLAEIRRGKLIPCSSRNQRLSRSLVCALLHESQPIAAESGGHLRN